MDFKTSDGIRINYYVYGAGKPVVLIHGFGGYQQIWCLQIKNLIVKLKSIEFYFYNKTVIIIANGFIMEYYTGVV